MEWIKEHFQFCDDLLVPLSRDGVVPLCFLRVILHSVTTLFILFFGTWRIIQLSKTRHIPVQSLSKLIKLECFLIVWVILGIMGRSLYQLILGQGWKEDTYLLVSDAYILLGWGMALAVVIVEYFHGQLANLVLQIWFTLSFFLSSFMLQTTIPTLQTQGVTADFVIAAVQFPASMILCGIALLYRPNLQYEGNYHRLQRDEQAPHKDQFIKSNCIKASLFSWMNPLFALGYKRPLERSDMYQMPHELKSSYMTERFQSKWNRERQKRNPSLMLPLFKSFGMQFVLSGIYKLISDMLQFANPIILQKLIEYVSTPNEPIYMGFIYIGLMFAANLLQSIFLQHFFWIGFKGGIQFRGALVDAIYKKSFVLSNKARSSSTVGEIVNLQSIDANRFQEVTPYFHMMWSSPLQLAVALYMLWQLLGASSLAALAVFIIVAPLNGFFASRTLKLNRTIMTFKDQRTKLMSEILAGIRVIKFFAWEDSFVQKVEAIRGEELSRLRQSLIYTAMTGFMFVITPLMVNLATFALYTVLGNELTPAKAFTSLSLFNIMRFPLIGFPMILSFFLQLRVSATRIRKFLLQEESEFNEVHPLDSPTKPSIELKHCSFQWDSQRILNDISLQVPKGKFVAVVGSVGSGKSSLLSGILGEIPRTEGTVVVNGSIAYVPQHAWIQNATIRDNILFGKCYNREKYESVLRACELEQDLVMFPNGDQTEIGERGINLSGGQKQRISIARAVYHDAVNYLLDDCLSAVDAHVGTRIFENCILGLLQNSTRIFVTHQLQFVPHADIVIVLDDHQITEIGSYEDLMSQQGLLYKLITDHSIQKYEQQTEDKQPTTPAETRKAEPKESQNGKIIAEEEKAVGRVSWSVWKAYLVAAGSFFTVLVMVVYMLQFASLLATNFWLSVWSSSGTGNVVFYLTIYAVLSGVSAVLVLVESLGIAFGGLQAAVKLHKKMLMTVMRAPTSFFESTPLGRVLNRFSSDQYTVDSNLPNSIDSVIYIVFMVLSVIVVIGYVTPFFLTTMLPLGAIYLYVQRYYLTTSRELKRLDSITNSPIYSQFSETLGGISTIKAYKKEDDFIQNNMQKVDANISVYACLTAANRWLGIHLQFVGTMVVTLSAVFIVISRTQHNPGMVGLSLSYGLQLTGVLNFLVRNITAAETQMVSAERLIAYSNLPQEAPPHTDVQLPSGWINEGRITFINAQLRYREGLDLVLKGINMDIKAGEKVGIVGRTGAGKSSLVLAIFRIVELAGGQIYIDGVDVSTVGLYDLRTQLSIIPQDPVLFTGSVRDNLDPFRKHTESEIWRAIETVQLKSAIELLPEKLEAVVTEHGDNFSAGQQQLIALARAILVKAKVIFMDEATAAVDIHTDALIQQTIRTEFASNTVITIAHRINTIMDYDRVAVFDNGRIVEFDNPRVLLSKEDSVFHSLATQHTSVQSTQ